MAKLSRIICSLIVTLFSCTTLLAASLTSGKVYRIRNAGKTGQSMAMSGQGVVSATTDLSDLKQQWYLTAANGGWYLQNAFNGAYLTSPKTLYTQWSASMVETPNAATMLMSITNVSGNQAIRANSHNDSYGYAHSDASNEIVCWTTGEINSLWAFEEVPMTDDELQAMRDRFQNINNELGKTAEYQTYLDNLFSDKACTVLKAGGDLAQNASYKALPAALQAMADKVSKKDWAETSGNWDDAHAKKYRVQLYEPYSEGSAAAGMAGIQAYTNMNNPTGIVADAGDFIYVMVDEDIKEGATLYIGSVPDNNMHNNVTSGIALHKGLNIILCSADNTHYFIYYTVNTVKDKKPYHKLADFQPLKIHIEGGRLNGFFNYVGDDLYTPDTKADYEYTSQRATHPMYDLIGKYVILHFFLEDTPNMPGEATKHYGVKSALNPAVNTKGAEHDPAKIVKSWDDMCFAERMLMGIQSNEDVLDSYNRGYYETIVGDRYQVGNYSCNLNFQYSDYFNNRMMAITLQAQGLYMNATSWRTAYAPSTLSDILTNFTHGSIWGPAHEYGHMNQGPMKIAGTTEVSNNIFSNVALYFSENGTTSRCDYMSNQLDVFNKGKTFLENGTWGTTRMFWQLWCYYHATKHNTKFYPRLYELLRNYPLERKVVNSSPYNILYAKTDLLHFAKMCCVAAGEDLTNFFTAWGFFVPQDKYHVDDYDVYDCILTQAEIDEVKREIAAMKLPKNDAIILIDDRPGSDRKSHGEYAKEGAGELGGLDAFSTTTAPSGNFGYTVDGNTISVTTDGTDGVGYLVYDAEDNLIGFSNSHTFELSADAAEQLVNGTAKLVAVGSDQSTAQVVNTATDGTVEEKKALLKQLIDRCDALIASSDNTGTKVGHFRTSSCGELQALRDEAYDLWNATATTGEMVTESYLGLFEAYYALQANEDARVPFVPGASYRLVNKRYTNRALTTGTTNCASVVVSNSTTTVPDAQCWVFEPVSNGNTTDFYLRNKENGKYIGTTRQFSAELPLVTTPQSYTLITIEPGVYAFAPSNGNNYGIHVDASYKIVQWYPTAEASNWTMTMVDAPDFDLVVTDAGYATYYNDKATVLPAGLEAAVITGTQNGNGLIIDYRYSEGSVIPANTGVLIKGEPGSYTCAVKTGTTNTPPADNLLRGSVAETTTTGGDMYYRLSYNEEGKNLGFYWGADNGGAFTNGAHKAYLVFSTKKNVGYNALILDDETTDVATSLAPLRHSPVDIYSIDGRTVRTQDNATDALDGLPKGIYIVDGKKYIVK